MMSSKPPDQDDSSPIVSVSDFTSIFLEAVRLDRARDHAGAARLLDDGLKTHERAPAPLRFQALVLRADVAVAMDELIEARGVLAEAKQVALCADDRELLGADLRRVDDLEAFLTHRGCAG